MKSPPRSTTPSTLRACLIIRYTLLFIAALATTAIALRADVNNLPPGYAIMIVSGSADASEITQLAFKPGDMTHVYAARTYESKVSRYDYDPVTGELSNETVVASNSDNAAMVGIAFHGTNLYVTFEYGGDGRITRFLDSDGNGLYEKRHDFVHSIPTGDHLVNQLQVLGDSLFVGIGGAGRIGDPDEENIYTMTVARVADLNQVITTNVAGNHKGPINYLANTTEWTNTAAADGFLRYFASGFRNPFGIAINPDGQLWVSVNGNHRQVGFISDDLLYKDVQLGDEGDFPLPEFGFSKYITGNPITSLSNFGVSPSPTGFDFIADGPDAGKALVASSGATDIDDLGRDLVLVNDQTGAYEQIYQFSTSQPDRSRMTDVQRDPYGRFLITDFALGNVWLLTPPLPAPTLAITAQTNDTARLSWPLTGVDYELQETSNIMNTNSWAASAAVIEIGTNAIQTEISSTDSTMFFRLTK